MGKVVGGLLSIIGMGGKTPSVSNAAATQVASDQKEAKTARAALYATQGGVQGQDLNPDQVKKRQTLLGN